MTEKVDLEKVDTDDLIDQIELRGHNVDRESDIDDFSEAELREALGLNEDDADIDWHSLYNKFQMGNEKDAMNEVRTIIQQRTGRILT